MHEKKNALAELAKRITDVLAFAQDELYLEHKQTLDKCERIVAELAKVGYWKSTGRPHFEDAVSAVSNCRAIAEDALTDALEHICGHVQFCGVSAVAMCHTHLNERWNILHEDESK